MPLYRKLYYKKEAIIWVWKITETEDELRSLLPKETSLDGLKKYKSGQHRLQFLASMILQNKSGVIAEVHKDENGKPHINTGFISLSHDTCYAALMKSEKPCGVDMQSINYKVKRVEHKFMDEDDYHIEQESEVEYLTMIWSAKESVYKVNGDPLVYFKEHIRIGANKERFLEARILKEDYLNEIKIEKCKIDDVILTFTR